MGIANADSGRKRLTDEIEKGDEGDWAKRARRGSDHKKKRQIQGDENSGKGMQVAEGEKMFPSLTGGNGSNGGVGCRRFWKWYLSAAKHGRQGISMTTQQR